jgi:hypothetical protein
LAVTGTFDQPTFDAVEAFQTKYVKDVLNPWATTTPTGFVYIFTKQKINQIYCANPNGINLPPPTIEQINQPQVLPTNEVGINTRISNLASVAFAYPFNWIKSLFNPAQCTNSSAYVFWFVDFIIIGLLTAIFWLLYKKRKNEKEDQKTIDDLNKEMA